jgi:Hemerythrin HHE cation binding domain
VQVQFVCGIPVLSARSVLAWLCRGVSAAERASLVATIKTLPIDPHLARLVCLWLTLPAAPVATSAGDGSGGRDAHSVASTASAVQPLVATCAQRSSGGKADSGVATGAPGGEAVVTGCLRDPLDLLVHLHRGLLHALAALCDEAGAQRAAGRVSRGRLDSLTRRWQFLCAMSAFHRLSEDLFVFPAARAAADGAAGAAAACGHCEAEHLSEAESLTALGRLLSDLGSCTRRGAAHAGELLDALVATAADVKAAMAAHTAREEERLLPELRARLDTATKHALVRQTLQARATPLPQAASVACMHGHSGQRCTSRHAQRRLVMNL